MEEEGDGDSEKVLMHMQALQSARLAGPTPACPTLDSLTMSGPYIEIEYSLFSQDGGEKEEKLFPCNVKRWLK